jgi:hypothetical protein
MVVVAALLLAAGLASADENSDERKEIRAAFKALPLLPLARLDKQLDPRLPNGIVIESGPFDDLVRHLLSPLEEAASRRERAVAERGAQPSAAATLAAGLKTLEKENRELAARVTAVEASYGEAWDKGWMDAGTKQRRARQKAAVLIPFHRTLALRNGAVAARCGEALARSLDEGRRSWLSTAAARDSTLAVRVAAVAALGRATDAAALESLRRALRADRHARVRFEALASLALWPSHEVRDDVVAALEDDAWEVRSLAAAFCATGGLVDAALPLVAALERERGRLQTDFDAALGALLGVRFHGDAALWRRWLEENPEALKEAGEKHAAKRTKVLGPLASWSTPPGSDPAREDGAAARKEATSSFYGIDTLSRRVLFVVDISRSMLDQAVARPPTATGKKERFTSPKGNAKIDVARWQLHRAIESLPEDAVFNLVVFSESYKTWRSTMTGATARNKAAAHLFIDALPPNGTTNICDPLDAAFDLAGAGPLAVPGKKAPPGLAVDTVFLLSDGNPNRGRICDLEALLEEVVERNLRTRMVVHAVGIGEVAGSSFLEGLATRTGGRYVGFR